MKTEKRAGRAFIVGVLDRAALFRTSLQRELFTKHLDGRPLQREKEGRGQAVSLHLE